MRKAPTLSAKHLTAAGACPEQVKLFRKTFPKGAPLTLASARKARKAGLDLSWCANLLDDSARKEYDRVDAPAWEKYQQVSAPARKKYQRADAAAWEEYLRAIAAALVKGLQDTFNRRGDA
jgi:hypothetical protein